VFNKSSALALLFIFSVYALQAQTDKRAIDQKFFEFDIYPFELVETDGKWGLQFKDIYEKTLAINYLKRNFHYNTRVDTLLNSNWLALPLYDKFERWSYGPRFQYMVGIRGANVDMFTLSGEILGSNVTEFLPEKVNLEKSDVVLTLKTGNQWKWYYEGDFYNKNTTIYFSSPAFDKLEVLRDTVLQNFHFITEVKGVKKRFNVVGHELSGNEAAYNKPVEQYVKAEKKSEVQKEIKTVHPEVVEEIAAKQETELKAKKETEFAASKALKETEEKKRIAAEESKRIAEEAQAKAKAEEEKKKAETKALKEAEEKARIAAEQKTIEEAKQKAAVEEARRNAEANLKADVAAKEIAELKAKLAAEEKARQTAELKAKLEEEEKNTALKALKEAEQKAVSMSEQKAAEEAEKQAALKALKEAEENAIEEAKKKAAEEAKHAAELAAQKAKKEADIKAAVSKALRETEEKDRLAAEQKAKDELKLLAEAEKARKEAEVKAAVEKTLKEVQEKERLAAEQHQKEEAMRIAETEQAKLAAELKAVKVVVPERQIEKESPELLQDRNIIMQKIIDRDKMTSYVIFKEKELFGLKSEDGKVLIYPVLRDIKVTSPSNPELKHVNTFATIEINLNGQAYKIIQSDFGGPDKLTCRDGKTLVWNKEMKKYFLAQ
jgi:hypothetical protein